MIFPDGAVIGMKNLEGKWSKQDIMKVGDKIKILRDLHLLDINGKIIESINSILHRKGEIATITKIRDNFICLDDHEIAYDYNYYKSNGYFITLRNEDISNCNYCQFQNSDKCPHENEESTLSNVCNSFVRKDRLTLQNKIDMWKEALNSPNRFKNKEISICKEINKCEKFISHLNCMEGSCFIKEDILSTQDKIDVLFKNFSEFLKEKNRRYGDSAINPIKIFSKIEPNNPICSRLDEKLQRIMNSKELSKNDVGDAFGYLGLLMVEKDWLDFGEMLD